uniref:zinc finger protein OZF-like n=1 Tax=Semicossyphus pulcher TaxID=241346 RepID=UPI0037E8E86A
MSKVQMVRAFVNQRLTAAAEEIFELFERTIAEYEEELCRSKDNQHKLHDTVFNRDVDSHRADVKQLLVRKEEVPPEQQEWIPSLDQEDPPEPPHIKQEQEELWGSQGEQLQGPEEADIIKFTFTPVPVKSDEDNYEGEPQLLQLHQTRTEENRDSERLKTAHGQDCGGSESYVEPATHAKSSNTIGSRIDGSSCQVEVTIEPQSDLNPLQNNKSKVKPFICSVCGKRYPQKRSLSNHMRLHSEGKFFSCSICKKTFPWRRDVVTHMRIHTGEKPFSCSFCGAKFAQSSHLTLHLRVHTGEKPFTCSVCKTSFSVRKSLVDHMTIHTGEKPFSCSVCGKRFAQNGSLRRHLAVHTGEKPFHCSVCEKRFTRLEHVKNHKCAGESSRRK